MSPLDNHPFTVCSIPSGPGKNSSSTDSNTPVFLVRGYTGFTGRLLSRSKNGSDAQFTTWIDGPYGSPHKRVEGTYETAMLIAGGGYFTFDLTDCLSGYPNARWQCHDKDCIVGVGDEKEG